MSQVAARVNGEEITVHQVNHVLRSDDEVTDPSTAGQALDRLIEEELLIQAAKKEGIDRRPEVLDAMEAARRDALVQAYLEQVRDSAGPAGDGEVRAYYGQHPELFSERRIYLVRQLAVRLDGGAPSAPEAVEARLRDTWAGTHDWIKLQAVAKAADPSAVFNTRSMAPEELTPAELGALRGRAKGSFEVRPMRNGLWASEVLDVALQPMSEGQAEPMIRNYLAEKRGDAAVRDLVTRLEHAATVERVGDFAAEDKQPLPAAPAPAVDSKGR